MLALMQGENRACAMTFLAGSLALQPRGGAIQLSETLFQLRSGLREHLPVYTHSADQPRGPAVESIMAVDDRSFYIEGWVRDEESDIVRITAGSPRVTGPSWPETLIRSGGPTSPTSFPPACSAARETNESVGFISFFELESPKVSEHRVGAGDGECPGRRAGDALPAGAACT